MIFALLHSSIEKDEKNIIDFFELKRKTNYLFNKLHRTTKVPAHFCHLFGVLQMWEH